MLGLGTGAVYAAIGLGLVLAHRASGVVNFAHGAMAMYATYVFVALRVDGDLVLPVVGLPARIHVADHPPFVLDLAVALTAAALLGLAVYALVFRPLRAAPVLARVVASVGLMVVLQAVVVLRFGSSNRPVPAILPNEPVHLFGLVLARDRLYLAGLVAAAAAVLWALYRFTRFGLATRAAAENEMAASLMGYSPDRLAAANWVIASVLAGLGGILVGPITALNPVTYTLLVVPALAAALVGRLSSFGVTVVTALGLGMAQSEVVKLQGQFSWIPRLGVREGLPLVVIVVAMAVGGSLIPGRSAPTQARLPAAGRPGERLVPLTVILAVLASVALVGLHGQYRLALIDSMVGATICLSIVVLTGYVGQISLAQMAFAGVAGFTLSKLAHGLGVPFPFSALLAAAVAAAAGLLIGVPALRVRGINLAVVTIAAAVAVEELVFKNVSLTGGLEGTKVPHLSLFGLDLGIGGRRAGQYPRPVFGFAVLAVLIATALGVARLRRGALGRRLLAIRANERAAEAAGVNVAATKLTAFALSAFIAGVGGALIGYEQGQLSFDSFDVFVSLSFLAVTYLGGIASISGALVGGSLVASGIVFTVLDRIANLGRYQLLISGVGLIAMAILNPEGIAGLGSRLAARRERSSGEQRS